MKGILSQHDELFRYDYLYEKAPISNDFFCHFHNEYELLLFYNGNASFNIDNQTFDLRKNDLLIIHPAQYHKLFLFSSIPYERSVFNFQRRVLSPEEIEILENTQPIYHIEKGSVLYNLFENLKNCEKLYSNKDFERLKEESLRSIIINLKYLPKTPEILHQNHTILDDIINFINEHIQDPLNAQLIADRFFVSKSYIDQIFTKHLKISCKRFINRKKILYAQNLISTGVSAIKAAEICGYTSYATFYRQYKMLLGLSPIQDKADDESAE